MGSLIGKIRDAVGGPPVPMGGESGMWRLPGLSMSGGGNAGEALMRSYGTVGTIFSIVSLYADATARAPWEMFRQQQQDKRVRYTTRDEGSDQRTQVVQHAALSLLNNPNPFWTRRGLMELGQMYLDLCGEAYEVLDIRAGIPVGRWSVRPDRMEPVPDPDTYLKGYVYTSPDGKEKIPLLPGEVIQVKYPNPLDPYHGIGPVQSVLVDIDAARYSAEWNRNFFVNSATPGGVIQVDHRLDDDEWDDLTTRWRETHTGVSRAHRVAVLEAGATWVPNQHTMRDMDFGNLRGVMRDVMREAFRMHKVMLGVSDDVNRANAQTGEEVFSSWGVVPRLDRWKDTWNGFYLPLFGATGRSVELDYVRPIPTNREQDNLELTSKANAVGALVDAGYDPHDVLEVVGLPDMKTIPKPPAGGLPVGTPGAGMGAPAPAAIPGEAGQGGDAQNMRQLRISAGWDSPAWDALEEMRRNAAWNSVAGAR